MPYSFSTALSGLSASATQLGITGNNIANANTVAFKSSSASFADLFTNSQGVRLNGANQSLQVGNGVALNSTITNYSQGTLSDSGSSTSAAIQGQGFFIATDANGGERFTRAGDFTTDRAGYLVTPTGLRVQGYAAVNGVISAGAALSAIQFPIGETIPPVATTEATLRLNLNSASAVGSAFHSPVKVFDTKGVAHNLDLIFTKQANGSFLMSPELDGNPAGANGAALPISFTFDANGLMTTPALLTIEPDQTLLDGATLASINVNLYKTNPDGSQGAGNITSFATASAVTATDQDGFSAGSLNGFSLSSDRDGTIVATFTNGQTTKVGQLAIAIFNAQDGLRHMGGNFFGQTIASGQPSIGAAGTGGRGDVVGGTLEQSNVDIASELTQLIVAQRGFQANSRVITSINQTLQDLLQLV